MRPVGEHVPLAIGDRDRVPRGDVGDPLRRLRQRIAIDRHQACAGATRIAHRAARAARLDEQVGVVDLGVVVRRAHRDQQVVGQIGVEVELEALAIGALGVDQGIEVGRPTDCRQLLVVDPIVEHREADPRPAVPQVCLNARLDRGQGLLVRNRDRITEQNAPLNRGRAESPGKAAEHVDVVIERIDDAQVATDVAGARIGHQRTDRSAANRRLEAPRTEVLAIAGVAQAAAQGHGLAHVVLAGAVDRPGFVLLILLGETVLATAGQCVEGKRVDGDVLVEVEQARLPVEGAPLVGFEAQFLGQLRVIGQPIRRLRRKGDEARTERRRERRAKAAVDVAATKEVKRLPAGDRMSRHRTEVPAQARAGAPGVEFLSIVAVDRDAALIEARHHTVATALDDVGAEQARRTIETARMPVEQGVEVVAGRIPRLQTHRELAVAFQLVDLRVRGHVVHPVVAALVDHRRAHRHRVADPAADRALGVESAEAAVVAAQVGVEFRRGLARLELDHAGRGVAAEQRALRTAQHLDAVEVEHREALEDRVLLHDLVVDQRHRLRRIEIEVGVAEPAHVETRERAAERGFDLQAGQARAQETDVVAGSPDVEQFLRLHDGDRDRHLLHVFLAALCGDGDRL